jgi:hypothetical protein
LGRRGTKSQFRLRLRGTGALLAALGASLALAAPALAGGITATSAPISGVEHGYLVTIVNESGASTEGPLLITQGSGTATNVAPGECIWNQPSAGSIGCPKLESGQTRQLCYTGGETEGVAILWGGAPKVSLTKAGPVGSCPVPGFNPSPAGGEEKKGDEADAGSVTLGKVKYNAKKGTATVSVSVPGTGTVKASGKGVKGASKAAGGAGDVGVQVKAAGKAAKKLAKTGKVTLKVTITFTPSSGSPVVETITVKLREH